MSSASAIASAPSPASPTTSMSGSRLKHQPEPAPDQRMVVGEQDPGLQRRHGPFSPWRQAPRAPAARRTRVRSAPARTVSSRADQRGPLPHPADPGPRLAVIGRPVAVVGRPSASAPAVGPEPSSQPRAGRRWRDARRSSAPPGRPGRSPALTRGRSARQRLGDPLPDGAGPSAGRSARTAPPAPSAGRGRRAPPGAAPARSDGRPRGSSGPRPGRPRRPRLCSSSTCAWTRASPSSTAVSSWPIWSCSSCAIRRRSASWPASTRPVASRRSASRRASISLNVSASSPASEVGAAPGIRSPGRDRSTRRASAVNRCSGATARRSSEHVQRR